MRKWIRAAAFAFSALASLPATAAVSYDVGLSGPGGTFFGTGNPNTHWTVNTISGVELGLQATQPFIGPITPVGDVYTAPLGLSPGHAPRAAWSFSFSFDGTGAGLTVGDLSELNLSVYDVRHAQTHDLNVLLIPDNEGFTSATTTEHNPVIATDNAVQNNTNFGFPAVAAVFAPLFDPNEDNSFIFTLTATCGTEACGGDGTVIGSVSMRVDAGQGIPEPASMAVLGVGLAGLTWGRRQIGRR